MELKDYLRIIRRRAWTVILCMVLVLVMHMLYLRSKPQYYNSNSQILIKGMEDFYKIVQADQFPFWNTLAYSTRLSLITSEAVIVRAVALMPDDFPELFDKDEPTGHPVFRQDDDGIPGAVARVRSGLTFRKLELEGEIIILNVQGTDGAFTRNAANAVAEAYTSFISDDSVENLNKAVTYLVSRRKELDEKILQLEVQHSQATEKRESAESINEPSVKIYSELVLQGKRALADLQTQLDSVEYEIKIFLENLESGNFTVLPEYIVNDELIGLKAQKAELARLLDDLSLKYTQSHDKVKKASSDLEAIEQKILLMQKETHDVALKRSIDRYYADLERKKAEREMLASAILKNQKQIDEAQAELSRLIVPKPSPSNYLSPESDPDLIKFYLEAQKNLWVSLNERLDSLEQQRKSFGINSLVRIISFAREGSAIPKPGESSWPFSLVIGLIVGIAVAYFLEYINTTVRTEYDIKRYLNIPFLGAIIKIKDVNQRLLLNVAPKMPLYEVYNTISALIESYCGEHKAKIVMVASSRAEEGKSTVTTNIATALANGGKQVIVIDCDLRKAMVYKFFNADNTVGISSLVLSQEEFASQAGNASNAYEKKVLQISDVLKTTEIPNLRIIPAGPHPQNPVGILKSDSFKRFLQEIRQQADIILIDVPPVNLAVDTIILSSLVDGIVFLVAAGQAGKEEVSYAKKLIESARGNLIGCILNKVTLESKGYYYYYYYYYDTYKYYRET